MTLFDKSVLWFVGGCGSVVGALIALMFAPAWFLFLVIGASGSVICFTSWYQCADRWFTEEEERDRNGSNPS